MKGLEKFFFPGGCVILYILGAILSDTTYFLSAGLFAIATSILYMGGKL